MILIWVLPAFLLGVMVGDIGRRWLDTYKMKKFLIAQGFHHGDEITVEFRKVDDDGHG